MTIGLVSAVGFAPAQARTASDPPSIDIMTTEAVGYGDEYDSDNDGVPDFVFRPHFTAKVRAVCPAGADAAVEFNLVTGNQLPVVFFTCTGEPQVLEIHPYSGHTPGAVVHLTTELHLVSGDRGSLGRIASDAQDVRILDVRFHPPRAPGLRVGALTASTVALHWTPAQGAGIVGYRFGWESLSGRPEPSWSSSVDSGPPNPFVMTNLCAGCTYRMWAEAVTAEDVGERAWVEVTTPGGPTPALPSPPRSLSGRPGNHQVRLTWLPPARTGGARVDRYCVRQSGHAVDRCTTTRAMTVRGLRNRVTYTFHVRGHTAAGWSGWSNAATIRPRR